MLTSRLLGALALVTTIGLVPGSACSEDKPVIRVGVIKNFPPYYTTLKGNGRPSGFAVELTEKLAERLKFEVQYHAFETWPGLLGAMKAGDIDLVPDMGDTPARRTFADFATPVRSFPISIFVRRLNGEIKVANDLDGRRVSVVESNVGVKLMAARPRATSVIHASTDQALLSLISGKTDALVYPRPILLHLAREAGLAGRLKTVGAPLLEVQRGIALRKGQPQLLAAVNRAIEEVVHSDEYQHLVETWFGDDPNAWQTEEIAAVFGALLFVSIFGLSIWRYASVVNLNRRLNETIGERDRFEQRFREFATASSDWYWEQDADLRFTDVTERMADASGLRIDQILGKTREELRVEAIDPFETASWQQHLDNVAARKSFENVFYWITGADGSKRCVSSSGRPMFDENGTFIGYHGVGRDVTSLVLTRQQNVTIEKRLAEAIETIPAFFALYDANDRLIICNSRLRQEFDVGDLAIVPGIHIDEIIEKYGKYGFGNRSSEERKNWVNARRSRRASPDGSFVFQKEDGHWFEVRDFILEDGCTITIGIDITAKREADEMLRLQERALASTPSGMVIADARANDMPIVYVNQAFERITGYRACEIVGRNCRFLQGEETQQSGLDTLRMCLREGKEANVLLKNFRKNGQPFWNEMRISFVRSSNDDPTHIVGILNDVTQRVETEAALHQAQKLEAVGQLSSGVAHDLNNILTVLRCNVDLLQRKLESDPRTDALVADAIGAIDRGSDLTTRLLNFARQSPQNPEIVDLAETVKGLSSFLQRSISGPHHVEVIPSEQPLPVLIDVGQFENALFNLTLNARDAMPEGGVITIASRISNVGEGLGQHTEHFEPDGAYVAIRVSDTGTGMTPEVKSKVFEPFFTTKGSGKGTGLGLSMVHGFVSQSGGVVSVDSVPGEGSTVTMLLPLLEMEHLGETLDEVAV